MRKHRPTTEYTVSDLAGLVGIPKRTVIFWTDAGILIPQQLFSGSGRHRRYASSELLICSILAQTLALNLPVGTLVKFANAIRRQPRTFLFDDNVAFAWRPDRRTSFEAFTFQGSQLPVSELMHGQRSWIIINLSPLHRLRQEI